MFVHECFSMCICVYVCICTVNGDVDDVCCTTVSRSYWAGSFLWLLILLENYCWMHDGQGKKIFFMYIIFRSDNFLANLYFGRESVD